MFGELEWEADIARELLSDFTFDEILQLNDLTYEDILEILIGGGHVVEPERYFPSGAED